MAGPKTEPTGKRETGDPPSIEDFMRNKRKEDCRVCRLSEDLRLKLSTASKKGWSRENVVEYLNEHFADDMGANVTDDELTTHFSGKHDRKLKEGR